MGRRFFRGKTVFAWLAIIAGVLMLALTAPPSGRVSAQGEELADVKSTTNAVKIASNTLSAYNTNLNLLALSSANDEYGDPTLHHVQIEDAELWGNVITDRTIAHIEPLTLWAIGYDEFSGRIGPVPVSWSGTGVCTGNVAPPVGISVTFTPIQEGTGTVQADTVPIAGFPDAETGTITVVAMVDLAVTDIQSPSSATSSQTIEISWTVMNNGPETVSTGHGWQDYVFLYADDPEDGSIYALESYLFSGILDSGDSYTAVHPVTIPTGIQGNFVINVQTDGPNDIYEYTAESNNLLADDQVMSIFLDTTPPDPPTGLSATAEGFSITLNWLPNGESDLKGYNVYRESIKINSTTVTGTSYSDSVSVGGVYTYKVTAVDWEDNESEFSDPASASAEATAPKIAEIGDESAAVGMPYEGPAPILIAGTEPLTWTLEASPAGMTIDAASGVVLWASPVTSGSPHTITIRATNAIDFDNETWLLTVVLPDNDGDGMPDDLDPDDDNDGMPDEWELLYPTCFDPFVNDANGDCDQDGYRNYLEYLGDSDPTDENSTPNALSKTFNLSVGLNAIALPFEGTLLTTAEELGLAIGDSCTTVARWDAASQSYQTHDVTSGGDGFDLAVGEAYFVTVSAGSSFEVTGTLPDSLYFSLTITLTTDFNAISMPYDLPEIDTAEELGNEIDGCQVVSRWDAATRSYQSHIVGFPTVNNFAVTPGEAYFVSVSSNVTWP